MQVTVCIGSSCHLKGSHRVVEELKRLIEENALQEQVELKGAFCIGHCQPGVSVTVNDSYFSVRPETVAEFFKKEIAPKAIIIGRKEAKNAKV